MFLAHSTCFFFIYQPLLDTNMLSENLGMFELVAGFLEEGEYFKGKSLLSRKVLYIIISLLKVLLLLFFTNKRNKIITFLPCDTVLIRALKKCAYDASITDVKGISFFKQSESRVI